MQDHTVEGQPLSASRSFTPDHKALSPLRAHLSPEAAHELIRSLSLLPAMRVNHNQAAKDEEVGASNDSLSVPNDCLLRLSDSLRFNKRLPFDRS